MRFDEAFDKHGERADFKAALGLVARRINLNVISMVFVIDIGIVMNSECK